MSNQSETGSYNDSHALEGGALCGRRVTYVGDVETVVYDERCAKCRAERDAAEAR